MTALAALAIARPDDAAVPDALVPIVQAACAGAWHAVEVVLAGTALREALGPAAEPVLREAVDALLAIAGDPPPRREALAALRAARRAGFLDPALSVDTLVGNAARAGDVPALPRDGLAVVRRELAAYPALDAALGESELAAVLVDTARAIVRHRVRGDAELERWAVAPTGHAMRDRALVTFAELAAIPSSLGELERLP
ncbi:MAG TPA: hypothetical protein VFQ53_26750 [Kofleriaceae bacterium]|nr:hypothetical protein [Kofleriaceae bacterium]